MNPHVEFVATSDWSIVASEPWIMIRGGFREKQRPPPPAISREINVPNLDKKVCMSNTHNTALGPFSLLFLSKAICNIMHSRVRDIVFLLNFTRAHTLKNRHWNRSIISFSSFLFLYFTYNFVYKFFYPMAIRRIAVPILPKNAPDTRNNKRRLFVHFQSSFRVYVPFSTSNVRKCYKY